MNEYVQCQQFYTISLCITRFIPSLYNIALPTTKSNNIPSNREKKINKNVT